MNMNTSSAALPVELVETIVAEAWNLPLCTEERISLMTSLPLVSRMWLELYNRISMKDVHIPCPSYADFFFRVLTEESALFSDKTKSLPNVQCRSLTFQIENESVHPPPAPLEEFEDSNSMGQTLGSMLYRIHFLSYLPNLTRVSINYLDWDFGDIPDQYRLVTFPSQVTELEINYAFSPKTPSWLVRALKENVERDDCLRWSLPSVKNITITGAGDSLVANLLTTVPNADTLTTDDSIHLENIAPFPEFMHTVLLLTPSGGVTRVEV